MIGIDVAHAQLITGLVMAFKPQNILELGFGDGVSHAAIMAGCIYNQHKPHYTLVDSWLDWGSKRPDSTYEAAKKHGQGDTLESFTVVTSEERNFIYSCLDPNSKQSQVYGNKFDFIMSDADHQQSDQWAIEVYDRVLQSPGILIYHDVSSGYPNLGTIKSNISGKFSEAKIMEFNRSTREDEECERGLLVIYKP